jgi:cytochrome c553
VKKYFITSLFMTAIVAIIIPSCKKEDGNEKKVSKHNETESISMSGNCMTCHKAGGPGEGIFNVAGTVFVDSTGTQKQPNGFVKLYTEPNGGGTLAYSLEVDGIGNFYSTEGIDFSNGLYPSVFHANGNVQHMPQITTTGACNSCHGITQKQLWVN